MARNLMTRPVWVVLCIVFLFIAVIFDTAAWIITAWGYGEEDTFYTTVGLWQVCNGSREVTKYFKVEVNRSALECIFPSDLSEDWMRKGMVMEIMGGFCAVATFITLFVFIGGLRLEWIQSRAVFVAMVPLAFLAGLMNLIGLLIISLNLYRISCSADYCVALDALGVVCFAFGGLSALLDLQGCCVKKKPLIGKGLMRPI